MAAGVGIVELRMLADGVDDISLGGDGVGTPLSLSCIAWVVLTLGAILCFG